jgi:hypothetical protein
LFRYRNNMGANPPRRLKPVFANRPVGPARGFGWNCKDPASMVRSIPGRGRCFALRARTRRGGRGGFGSLTPRIRHRGRTLRRGCGAAVIGARIRGRPNAGNSFVSRAICRGGPAGRRRRVGERAGVGPLGEAGERPQHDQEHVADRQMHQPADAMARALLFANASHFLCEENVAADRVLGGCCHC